MAVAMPKTRWKQEPPCISLPAIRSPSSPNCLQLRRAPALWMELWTWLTLWCLCLVQLQVQGQQMLLLRRLHLRLESFPLPAQGLGQHLPPQSQLGLQPLSLQHQPRHRPLLHLGLCRHLRLCLRSPRRSRPPLYLP